MPHSEFLTSDLTHYNYVYILRSKYGLSRWHASPLSKYSIISQFIEFWFDFYATTVSSHTVSVWAKRTYGWMYVTLCLLNLHSISTQVLNIPSLG